MKCFSCGFQTSSLGDSLHDQLKEIVEKKAPVVMTNQLWDELYKILFRSNRSGSTLCLVCLDKFCTMTNREMPKLHGYREGKNFKTPNFTCTSCNVYYVNTPHSDPVRLSFRRKGRDCKACNAFHDIRRRKITNILKLINPGAGYIGDLVDRRVFSEHCQVQGCEDRVFAYDYQFGKASCWSHFQALYPNMPVPENRDEEPQQQESIPFVEPPATLFQLAEACDEAPRAFDSFNIILNPLDEPVDIFNDLPVSLVLEDLQEPVFNTFEWFHQDTFTF